MLWCRLNYRLTEKCEADIDDLCADACNFPTGQACGGRVLRCLTTKQDQVKSRVGSILFFQWQQYNHIVLITIRPCLALKPAYIHGQQGCISAIIRGRCAHHQEFHAVTASSGCSLASQRLLSTLPAVSLLIGPSLLAGMPG